MEVASLEASLALVESERDALKERLVTAEIQRKTSLEQYQQEVETSVQEVTSQVTVPSDASSSLIYFISWKSSFS